MAVFDPAAFAAQLEGLETAGASVEALTERFRALNAEQAEAVKNAASAGSQLKDAADARKAELQGVVASAQAQKQLADRRREDAAAANDQAKSLKAQNEAIKAQIELLKAQADASPDPASRQAVIDDMLQQEQALEDGTKKLDKYQKKIEKTKQETDKFQESVKSMVAELEGFGKAAFGGEDAGNQFMKTLEGLGSKGVKSLQGIAMKAGALGPALAGVVGIVGVAVGAIAKLTIELFNTSNEIQKVTGVSDSFADSIVSGYEEARQFGGTLKELSTSAQELSKTFTDFTMMNGQAAKSLAVTATMMGKLGVSSSDFAKGVQLSTKALGATDKQAAQTQLNLAQLAMDIGVAPSQMAADFAAAGPHLSKFGRDAEKSFKSLAITAKSTGIEVGRLLQITEKFDTFEGAAEQAGKLNAALGGNFVNAMEMLTETDPAARFEMMTGAIKDAGLSFDDMSYYQRKFYADAMGLSDVSELALAMSGNTDALGKEARKTAADYEAMAKRAEEVQNLQEQLNVVFADMVPILMPMVELLGDTVKIMKDNKEVVQGFAVAFGVLGAGIALASLPIWSMAGAIAVVTSAVLGLAFVMYKKRNSPTFAESFGDIASKAGTMSDALNSLRNPFGDLIGDVGQINSEMMSADGFTANLKTSTKTMHELDNATMRTAQTTQAAAPVLSTSNAVSNAMTSHNSTTNNVTNGGGGSTSRVEIGLAQGFSDMFSAKVVDAVSKVGMRGLI
jgi:hypothetical protein